MTDASLMRQGTSATIRLTVRWNAAGVAAQGMTVGEVRAVAVNRTTGLATLVAASKTSLTGGLTQKLAFKITDPTRVSALAPGNRVVVTATQHGYTPTPLLPTGVSFVTVTQLQSGPPRGPVGRFDCSDRPLMATEADGKAMSFDECDFSGAALGQAQISTSAHTSYKRADFTGASLAGATLTGADLSGADLDSATIAGSRFDEVQMSGASAVGLVANNTILTNSQLDNSNFSRANFDRTSLRAIDLDHSLLVRTSIVDATIASSDLSYSNLSLVNLTKARISSTRLYLINLTGANLRYASIASPIFSQGPFDWATLCHTMMPPGNVSDRDCGTRKLQAPVPPRPLPTTLAHPGLTPILPTASFTNAGRRISVSALVRPLGVSTRGELFYARLVYGGGGRVGLLASRQPMIVRLTLSAPGDANYLPYRSVKYYTLR